MLALEENLIEPTDVKSRMDGSARRAGYAVRRPAVHEVRLCGEVRAWVYVMVPSRDDIGILAGSRAGQVFGNHGSDSVAALHRQRSALAKIALHIDD